MSPMSLRTLKDGFVEVWSKVPDSGKGPIPPIPVFTDKYRPRLFGRNRGGMNTYMGTESKTT